MTIEPTSTSQKTIVLLIHGTNAGDASDVGFLWWQRNSKFWKYLSENLGAAFLCQPENLVFHWSGLNSERERHKAGQNLAGIINNFERTATPYHLIGHSHGGSVIWHALQMARNNGSKLSYLKGWSTVGTPFLHFETLPFNFLWLIPFIIALSIEFLSFRNIKSFFENSEVIFTEPSKSVVTLGFLLLLWMIPLIFIIIISIRFMTLLFEHRKEKLQAKKAKETFDNIQVGYLSLWIDVDEAISGLKSTLTLESQVLPRITLKQSNSTSKILSILVKPFLFIYNSIIIKASDEFIWSRVLERFQGNDQVNYRMVSVTRSPIFNQTQTELPLSIKSRIIDSANQNAAVTLAKVRNVLGLTSEISNRNSPGLIAGIVAGVTFSELVHTTYFEDEGVCQLLLLNILKDKTDVAVIKEKHSFTQLLEWLNQNQFTPVTASENAISSSENIRKPQFPMLALLRITILLVGLIAAWAISVIVYNGNVYPNTSQYQFNFIGKQDLGNRIVGSGDIADYMIQNWGEGLVKTGFIDSAISYSNHLNIKNNLLLKSAIAHELLNEGLTEKAKSILDTCVQIVKKNDPEIDDDGFKALAEELAHFGDSDPKVLWAVNRLSKDRDDWKAEAWEKVAEGYVDNKQLEKAFDALRKIKKTEQRADVYETFIFSLEVNKPAQKRAVDSLYSLVPYIPDTRHWQSGSIQLCVEYFSKFGNFTNAYAGAKMIKDTGFRQTAYSNIAESLVDQKKVDQAKKFIANNFKEKISPRNISVLSKIFHITHDKKIKDQIIPLIEKEAASTSTEFREQQIAHCASDWADIGETNKCFEEFGKSDLGFYKESSFIAYDSALKKLVLLHQTAEIERSLKSITDPNLKCYLTIAFALAVDKKHSRKLLLQAESLVNNVKTDEDLSFAYSKIAEGWINQRYYKHAVLLCDRTRTFDRVNTYIDILNSFNSK